MKNLIIVGLGNPSKTYKKTRHNVGKKAILYLATQYGVGKWSFDRKSKCWYADILSGEGKITFILPENYMNRSGEALKIFLSARDWLSDVAGEGLLVLYDELDLPLGKTRISFGGSAGGHRGVQNIIDEIGTREFVRLRIGIASEKKEYENRSAVSGSGQRKSAADFVLGEFSFFENRKVKKTFLHLKDIISTIARDGHKEAMNKFN